MALQHGIVLAHGYLGFGQIGTLEYFRGVKAHLLAGGCRVLETSVDPEGSVEIRAAELQAQILAGFGGQPAHVIAHSMGGLDARYLIQPRVGKPSPLIASVTTLCTPHRGTFLATIACEASGEPLRLLENPAFVKAMLELPILEAELTAQFAMHCMMHPFDDFEAVANMLETVGELVAHAGAQNFAPLATYLRTLFSVRDDAVLDMLPGADVRLFSDGPPLVPCFSYSAKAVPFDSLSPELILSNLILRAVEGDNDGLVTDSAATWEKFMGCLSADHVGVLGWGCDQQLTWFDQMVRNIRLNVPGA